MNTRRTNTPQFDVFLSYNSCEKASVETIARKLKDAGLRPWLDEWRLIPGEKWQGGLAEGLRASATCAVFIGGGGLGGWGNEELNVAQDRAVKDGSFRLFAVLLPGLADPNTLPDFLRSRRWVDFRSGPDDQSAFRILLCAIKGIPPEPDEWSESSREKVKWVLVLSATIDDVDKPRAEAIVNHLRKITGDADLTLHRIVGGSVNLILEGSEDGFERIEELYKRGQLDDVLGMKVLGVNKVPPPPSMKVLGVNKVPPPPISDNLSLLIGPSGSGKTFLLLAIGQACFQARRDNLRLSFVPGAPISYDALSVTELMNRSVKIITGADKDRVRSNEPSDISFEITAEGEFPDMWGKKKIPPTTLNLSINDGPGGALFADKEDGNASAPEILMRQDHLISKARNAKSLIFCIDITDPNPRLLYKNLRVLIGKMKHDVSLRETPDRGWWGQIADFLRGRQPEIIEQTRNLLNFDRFLILLNKVDRLCAQSGRKERPDILATMIDPVVQAKRALGVEFLNLIYYALKPGARFAIGVTSALGFHPVSGLPLANKDGFVPRRSATDSEILNSWRPFGVRDALFFIATGWCTGSVRLVRREDLEDPS